MKLPTLTAITLATAVIAAPAFAANTPAANAAGTATVVPPNNGGNAGSANNGAADQNANTNVLANKTLIEKGTLPAPGVTANAPVAPAGTAPNVPSRTITVAIPNPGAGAAEANPAVPANPEVAVATPGLVPSNPATPGLVNNPIGMANVKPIKNNDNNNNNDIAGLPHQRNPVLADNGLPRAGKVIGSDIFDARDKQIGSVDGILMGVNGRPDMAVVAVNDADKKVLVPFQELVFGNTKITDDNRVIMPNQTQASLARLAAFNYHANNNNNAINNTAGTATGASVVAPGVNGTVAANGVAPAAPIPPPATTAAAPAATATAPTTTATPPATTAAAPGATTAAPATTAAAPAVTPAAPGASAANAVVIPEPNQNSGANNGGVINNGIANNGGAVNGIATNNNGGKIIALPGKVVTNNPIGTATVATISNNRGNNNGNGNNAPPHTRNPVLADNGLPRAGKVIGSAVYDLANKKVGSVDDILMGVNGQPDQAVVHVNDGNKNVLVPFRQLIFGNTNITDNNRVILPNQTNASLATLPTFNYHRNNA